MSDRLTLNERRIYREIGLPVSAFDVLQDLKRAWRLPTNAEVFTRLLLGPGRGILLKSAADAHTTTERP